MPTIKFYRRDYLLFQVTVFSKTNYCTSYKNYLHSPNYKSFYRVENIELFGWKVDSSYTRIIFYKIWNNEGKFEKFQFLKEMVLHADWWRGLWVVSSPHAIILSPISYAALCGWVQPTISRETLLSRSPELRNNPGFKLFRSRSQRRASAAVKGKSPRILLIHFLLLLFMTLNNLKFSEARIITAH